MTLLTDAIGAFNMHSIGHASALGANSATNIAATTMSISGYLGSARVAFNVDTTDCKLLLLKNLHLILML